MKHKVETRALSILVRSSVFLASKISQESVRLWTDEVDVRVGDCTIYSLLYRTLNPNSFMHSIGRLFSSHLRQVNVGCIDPQTAFYDILMAFKKNGFYKKKSPENQLRIAQMFFDVMIQGKYKHFTLIYRPQVSEIYTICFGCFCVFGHAQLSSRKTRYPGQVCHLPQVWSSTSQKFARLFHFIEKRHLMILHTSCTMYC